MSELKRTLRVGFPEIDAGPEPIVVIIAEPEGCSG